MAATDGHWGSGWTMGTSLDIKQSKDARYLSSEEMPLYFSQGLNCPQNMFKIAWAQAVQEGSAQAGGQEAHRAEGQVGQEVEEQWRISTSSSSSPISTSNVSSSSPRSSTLLTR